MFVVIRVMLSYWCRFRCLLRKVMLSSVISIMLNLFSGVISDVGLSLRVWKQQIQEVLVVSLESIRNSQLCGGMLFGVWNLFRIVRMLLRVMRIIRVWMKVVKFELIWLRLILVKIVVSVVNSVESSVQKVQDVSMLFFFGFFLWVVLLQGFQFGVVEYQLFVVFVFEVYLYLGLGVGVFEVEDSFFVEQCVVNLLVEGEGCFWYFGVVEQVVVGVV